MLKSNQISGLNNDIVLKESQNSIFSEYRLLYLSTTITPSSSPSVAPNLDDRNKLASSKRVKIALSKLPDLKWQDVEQYNKFNPLHKEQIKDFVKYNHGKDLSYNDQLAKGVMDTINGNPGLYANLGLNANQLQEWERYSNSLPLPGSNRNIIALKGQLNILKNKIALKTEIHKERLNELKAQEVHDSSPLIFKPFTWLNKKLQSDNAGKVYADRNAMFGVLEESARYFVQKENHNNFNPGYQANVETTLQFKDRMIQGLIGLIGPGVGRIQYPDIDNMLKTMIEIQRIEQHRLIQPSNATIKATSQALLNHSQNNPIPGSIQVDGGNLILNIDNNNVSFTRGEAKKMFNISELETAHDDVFDCSGHFLDMARLDFDNLYSDNIVLQDGARAGARQSVKEKTAKNLQEGAKLMRSSKFDLNLDNLSAEQQILGLGLLAFMAFKMPTFGKFLGGGVLAYLGAEAFGVNPVDFINEQIQKAKSKDGLDSIGSKLLENVQDEKEQIAVGIMGKLRPSQVLDYLKKSGGYDSAIQKLEDGKGGEEILELSSNAYGSEAKSIKRSLRTYGVKPEHYAKAMHKLLRGFGSGDEKKGIAYLQKMAGHEYAKDIGRDRYKLADGDKVNKNEFKVNKELGILMYERFGEIQTLISGLLPLTIETIKIGWERAKDWGSKGLDLFAGILKSYGWLVSETNNEYSGVFMPDVGLLSLSGDSYGMTVKMNKVDNNGSGVDETKTREKMNQMVEIINKIRGVDLPDAGGKIDIPSSTEEIQEIWKLIYEPVAPNTTVNQETKLKEVLGITQNSTLSVSDLDDIIDELD